MAGLQPAVAKQLQERHERDTYTRLLAPQQLGFHNFREHKQVEGLRQNLEQPDFLGSDLLFKLETIYGKIQMGYDPQRGEPFLFANIKTSILDAAPSRYQRELNEQTMFRQTKSGNQNLAFTSRRWAGSIVLLYKRESKKWSQESIAPYLGRVNMEALHKTMPFLQQEEERALREQNRAKKRELENELRSLMLSGEYARMAVVRRREQELLHEQELLQSLLIRKDRQSQHFFRRLNMAYDWQKHEMFAYYRNRRNRPKAEAQQTDAIVNKGDEGEGDE